MIYFKGEGAVAMALFCSATLLPAGAATDKNVVGADQSAPAAADGSVEAEGEYKRTIENLYYACLAEDAAATSWCSAYLIGVADTLSTFSSHKAGLCGAAYRIEQLGPIFIDWVRQNPHLKDIDMVVGASIALRQQWPCS